MLEFGRGSYRPIQFITQYGGRRGSRPSRTGVAPAIETTNAVSRFDSLSGDNARPRPVTLAPTIGAGPSRTSTLDELPRPIDEADLEGRTPVLSCQAATDDRRLGSAMRTGVTPSTVFSTTAVGCASSTSLPSTVAWAAPVPGPWRGRISATNSGSEPPDYSLRRYSRDDHLSDGSAGHAEQRPGRDLFAAERIDTGSIRRRRIGSSDAGSRHATPAPNSSRIGLFPGVVPRSHGTGRVSTVRLGFR